MIKFKIPLKSEHRFFMLFYTFTGTWWMPLPVIFMLIAAIGHLYFGNYHIAIPIWIFLIVFFGIIFKYINLKDEFIEYFFDENVFGFIAHDGTKLEHDIRSIFKMYFKSHGLVVEFKKGKNKVIFAGTKQEVVEMKEKLLNSNYKYFIKD